MLFSTFTLEAVMLISRRNLTLLASFGMIGLIGCAPAGKEAASGDPKPEAGAASTVKIGLITPGKVNDGGWCQLAQDSVNAIAKETGATLTPAIEEPAKAEVEAAIRQLAEGGNTLVFLHGSEYDTPAAAVAKDFPNTTFVVVGGRSEGANLLPLQISEREATYLAGYVAASLSKTHKIAAVGGIDIKIIKSGFEAYVAGAKAADPKVDVRVTYTGSFDDQAKAKQQTQALLAAGVDVFTHNANAAGAGVAQAIEEDGKALFIGANAPQTDLAPKQNIGAFIIDTQKGYLVAAKAVLDKKTDGKAFKLGIKDGATRFEFNAGAAGLYTPELKAKVDGISKDIEAGNVKM